MSQGRNARYRWGVQGRWHSHFTIEAHSHHGFFLRVPADTRVVPRGIGLCEAAQSLTDDAVASCAVLPAASSWYSQQPVARRFQKQMWFLAAARAGRRQHFTAEASANRRRVR